MLRQPDGSLVPLNPSKMKPRLHAVAKSKPMPKAQVDLFLKAQHPKNFANIFIKHMPAHWDEAAVAEVFGKYGTVSSVSVQKGEGGRRFAFVNFEAVDDVRKATEMHGKDVRTEEQKMLAGQKSEEEEDKLDGRELHVAAGVPRLPRLRA